MCNFKTLKISLHLKSHIFTFTFDISSVTVRKLGVKRRPHLTLRGCRTDGKPNNLQLLERVSRCGDVNAG